MRKPSLSKRVINGFEVMAMHLERDPVQLLFGKREEELNAQERGVACQTSGTPCVGWKSERSDCLIQDRRGHTQSRSNHQRIRHDGVAHR